jgi:hypothetical protein
MGGIQFAADKPEIPFAPGVGNSVDEQVHAGCLGRIQRFLVGWIAQHPPVGRLEWIERERVMAGDRSLTGDPREDRLSAAGVTNNMVRSDASRGDPNISLDHRSIDPERHSPGGVAEMDKALLILAVMVDDP